MRLVGKRVIFFMCIVLGMALVAILTTYRLGLSHAYVVHKTMPTLPRIDAATPISKIRGKHIVEAYIGCPGCHQENMSGKTLVETPSFASISAPNLTHGQGGLGATFVLNDWLRTLRLGSDREGRSLWCMPRAQTFHLGPGDLASVLAYIKALPPVDHTLPRNFIGWRGYVALALRRFSLVVPEPYLDARSRAPVQFLPWQKQVAVNYVDGGAAANTAEEGDYVARLSGCYGCHAKGQTLHTPRRDSVVAGVCSKKDCMGVPWAQFAKRFDAHNFVQALQNGRCDGGQTCDAAGICHNRFGLLTTRDAYALFASVIAPET